MNISRQRIKQAIEGTPIWHGWSPAAAWNAIAVHFRSPQPYTGAMPNQERRRGQAISVWEANMGTLMTVSTGGVVLTGYMLWLGADSFQIGLLSSIPAFAGLLQLVSPLLVEKAGSRKSVVLVTVYLTRIFWLTAALLPFYFIQYSPVWLLIGLVSMATLFGSITNVAYLSRLGDLVPVGQRSGFFAKRSQIAGLFSLFGTLLVGAYLDLWKAPAQTGAWQGREDPRGFVTVITAGAIFGFVSLMLLRAMPEPRQEQATRASFLQELFTPLRDPAMRLYILHKCIFAFGVGIAAPFFMVYAIKVLGLSYTVISGLSLIMTGATLSVMRLWGRLGDRYGDWPVLFWGTSGKFLVPLFWIFTSPDQGPTTYLALILLNLNGVFDAGLGLGTSNLLLRLSPPAKSTAYISVFTAISGTIGALAPIIGGLLANRGDFQLTIGPVTLISLQVLFLISAILRFASLLPLWSLRKV